MARRRARAMLSRHDCLLGWTWMRPIVCGVLGLGSRLKCCRDNEFGFIDKPHCFSLPPNHFPPRHGRLLVHFSSYSHNNLYSMAVFRKAATFRVSNNTANAVKAARVIRSIKSRYRIQAFLFLGYHFFLTSPMHLDIFIMFFILVSNFMNRQQAFPSQLLLDGLRLLLDERRFIMP